MPKSIVSLCICRDPQCTIPYGLCHCGCGKQTRLAKITNHARFRIAGQPYRYFHSHAQCSSGPEYLIENRGYKTPCWVWQRHINHNGYGMMRDETRTGKLRSAHKTYYERKYGAVPAGKQLDHLCRLRRCVNPDHLEPVVFPVNVARGASCTISTETILYVKSLLGLMSQMGIAKSCGISQSAVSDIKLGKKDWRLTCPELRVP